MRYLSLQIFGAVVPQKSGVQVYLQSLALEEVLQPHQMSHWNSITNLTLCTVKALAYLAPERQLTDARTEARVEENGVKYPSRRWIYEALLQEREAAHAGRLAAHPNHFVLEERPPGDSSSFLQGHQGSRNRYLAPICISWLTQHVTASAVSISTLLFFHVAGPRELKWCEMDCVIHIDCDERVSVSYQSARPIVQASPKSSKAS